MGGVHTTEQARDFIQERVTNVMQDTLISKATTVQTHQLSEQLMEGLSILPPPPGLCPPGVAPQDMVIEQNEKAVNTVGLSLTYLSAQDIAESVKTAIQDAVSDEVNKEQRGIDAIAGNTTAKQTLVIKAKTMNNLTTTIQMKLDTYISASNRAGQIMRNITVYMACRDTNVHQNAMQEGRLSFEGGENDEEENTPFYRASKCQLCTSDGSLTGGHRHRLCRRDHPDAAPVGRGEGICDDQQGRGQAEDHWHHRGDHGHRGRRREPRPLHRDDSRQQIGRAHV